MLGLPPYCIGINVSLIGKIGQALKRESNNQGLNVIEATA